MLVDSLQTRRKHRSDIDGLRAVAVLLVLGCHLNVHRMSGGYIGVDIFFVISGYLITGILARDVALDKLSLANFYERRLRRIVPALLGMLAVSSIAAGVIFPPRQLIAFGYSMLAALFSYANLYFATQNGYFTPAYTKLLQHTWSLGVEEQFYLFLPLLMVTTAKWSKNALKILVAGIWLTSLLWACWLVSRNADRAFFMPFGRAWELASGSALALGMVPNLSRRWVREIAAMLSMFTLLVCTAHYDSNTVFPGITALPVIVASVLIIGLGTDGTSLVTKSLGCRPAVFLGLISYSLYLWHWPILVILRLGLIREVDLNRPLQKLAVALGCVITAWLSWRYVEQPLRTGQGQLIARRSIFTWSVTAGLLFAGMALVFVLSRGIPSRFPKPAIAVGAYLDARGLESDACFYEHTSEPIRRDLCLTPVAGKKNFLLLGDSHAAMYADALAAEVPSIHWMELTVAGCSPYMGNFDRSNCGRVRRFLFEQYLPYAKPDAVVLSGRWKTINDFESMEPLLAMLHAKGIATFVIGPNEEFESPLPLILALSIRWSEPQIAISRQLLGTANLDVQIADRLVGRSDIVYLSAYKALCPAERCVLYAQSGPDVPILSDDNHLSSDGAKQVVREWVESGQLKL